MSDGRAAKNSHYSYNRYTQLFSIESYQDMYITYTYIVLCIHLYEHFNGNLPTAPSPQNLKKCIHSFITEFYQQF